MRYDYLVGAARGPRPASMTREMSILRGAYANKGMKIVSVLNLTSSFVRLNRVSSSLSSECRAAAAATAAAAPLCQLRAPVRGSAPAGSGQPGARRDERLLESQPWEGEPSLPRSLSLCFALTLFVVLSLPP